MKHIPTNIFISYLSSIGLLFGAVRLSSAFTSESRQRVFIGTPVKTTQPRLIADCMTPIEKLITLKQSSTVDEAVNTLLTLGLSGAPVVHDKTGDLVGIVSSFDFLQQEASEGTLLPPIENNSDKEALQSYFNSAKKICAKRVGDLMTTDLRTMESSESMRAATLLMAKEKLHRIPIVDSDGKLVGMLTSSDVMIDMVRFVKNLPAAKEEEYDDQESVQHSDLSP